MRVGIELVKGTKPFAHEVRWRSWWHLWSTVIVLIGCLTMAVVDLAWPIRLSFGILTGLVLVRLFIIYHDYLHGTILQHSRVADFVMMLYGVLSLNSPSVWKRSHNHHHKHNSKTAGSSIGSYPIMTTDTYAQASWKERFKYALARHPLMILFGYFTMFLFGLCLRPFILSPKHHYDAGIFLVLHVALAVALVILAPSVFLFAFVIPLLVASAIGAYLFYAQHNFPTVKIRLGSDWNYVSAALDSSSYITMNPVMHWFTGNIGYHHIHHLNAHIPFYRLPETMSAMPELQSPRTTSLTPVSIYRCLRLKLWDVNKDRMVNFKGV